MPLAISQAQKLASLRPGGRGGRNGSAAHRLVEGGVRWCQRSVGANPSPPRALCAFLASTFFSPLGLFLGNVTWKKFILWNSVRTDEVSLSAVWHCSYQFLLPSLSHCPSIIPVFLFSRSHACGLAVFREGGRHRSQAWGGAPHPGAAHTTLCLLLAGSLSELLRKCPCWGGQGDWYVIWGSGRLSCLLVPTPEPVKATDAGAGLWVQS